MGSLGWRERLNTSFGVPNFHIHTELSRDCVQIGGPVVLVLGAVPDIHDNMSNMVTSKPIVRDPWDDVGEFP